jgi:transcriptional regulator with XRE-family HTH domain
MGTRRASPTDRQVAKCLREGRLAAGITQEYMARELGVTFQQIQKYEKGTNRITAGRLYEVAAVLDLPITHFFEGVGAALRRSRGVKHRLHRRCAVRHPARRGIAIRGKISRDFA